MDPDLREQFCELYRRYYFYAFKRTLAFVKSESTARDITDEVFFKVVLELERGNRNVLNTRYLARMTTNLCIDRLRRQQSNMTVEFNDELVAGGWAGSEVTVDLRKLFESIPASLFEIAVYRLVDGYSLDEIAGLTGISKRTLQRKLGKLAARLAKFRG